MGKPLTQRQLLEALHPVKGHFAGSTVNMNTVLAAYMRSRKLSPTGSAWTLAKAALDAGASFSDAAAQADDVNSQVSHQTSRPRTDRVKEGSVKTKPDSMWVPERTSTTRPATDQSVHSAMTWFPKKFGPGDMNGQGAQRLLGTPNIPLTSVLVREMAQNSWDARTGGSAVRFTMNLRLLKDDEVRALRTLIFTGDATGLGLRESLDKDEVWVLEIADRGTEGLGGPVRNDVAVRPDQVTNFADLILTLGAPRDVHLGAGTYGFGKTVAYRASSCGTVLFWSRSREEAGIEDRVIGSAFGRAFNSDGLAFTGRHWWGHPVEDRIEPICGEEAAALASRIFGQGFDQTETGTSLLIIDPDLGVESPEETVGAIATAALWNLWPKMAEAGTGRTQMLVETLLNGEAVAPISAENHPLFGGFSDCLHQVRSVQSGGSYTPMFNTSTHEVWLERPRTLLGHLALTRFPYSGDESDDGDDVAAFSGPAHHVAVMRHDAELVVKYLSGEPLNSPGFQWAGVFKPVAETDNSFAEAEPPAHDDWSPAAIVDKSKRREVNVALRRIKELVAEFLGPINVGAANQTPGRSVAALADRLSGLLGAVPGSAPLRRPSRPGSGGGARQASASVQRTWIGPTSKGRRIMALRVTVDGSAQPVRVRADAGVGVEGAMDHDESRVVILGWVPGEDVPDLEVDPVTAEPALMKGQHRWLVVDADSHVSVDVNLRVGGDQR